MVTNELANKWRDTDTCMPRIHYTMWIHRLACPALSQFLVLLLPSVLMLLSLVENEALRAANTRTTTWNEYVRGVLVVIGSMRYRHCDSITIDRYAAPPAHTQSKCVQPRILAQYNYD